MEKERGRKKERETEKEREIRRENYHTKQGIKICMKNQ